jgi:hypothetical protein
MVVELINQTGSLGGIEPYETSFLQAQEGQPASGLPKKSLEERGRIWQLGLAIFEILEIFICSQLLFFEIYTDVR